MATDTESIHDNMTRLRMKMVQQKLAHEREKLQRSESLSTENGYEDQMKLKNAVLRRQELLDRIRQEQLNNEDQAKSYSPRRRYSPSPLPPPSRASLPEINTKQYNFGYNGDNAQNTAQVRHVIEHQFKTSPQQGYTQFPPLQTTLPQAPVMQPPAVLAPQQMVPYQAMPQTQVVPYQTMQPGYTWPAFAIADSKPKKDTMFNKSDFMDMMMLQNAQMHHMAMQQMMLHQLPGARPLSIPYVDSASPYALMRPSQSVYHHHVGQPNYAMPPMDYYQQGYGW